MSDSLARRYNFVGNMFGGSKTFDQAKSIANQIFTGKPIRGNLNTAAYERAANIIKLVRNPGTGMSVSAATKLVDSMKKAEQSIKWCGALGDSEGKRLVTDAAKKFAAADQALGAEMEEMAANGIDPTTLSAGNGSVGDYAGKTFSNKVMGGVNGFRQTLADGLRSIKNWCSRVFGPIWDAISSGVAKIKDFFVNNIFNPLKNFFSKKAWGESTIGDVALMMVALAAIIAIIYFVAKWAYKKYKNRKSAGKVRESYINTLNRQSFIEAKNVASFLKENTSMSKKECNKVANYVYKSSLNRKINNLI